MIRDLLEQFPQDEAIELAVDNAATFYLAGHETTANTMTWTLYLLSRAARAAGAGGGGSASALGAGVDAELPDRLPLLRAILEESLRLYPPVPRFDREAIAADRLGEHEVQPGDLVSIWPWIIHRHKRLWDEPDAFDPERFAAGRKSDRHRYPVSAVRRRPADVRRSAPRNGRGADHPRASGSAAGDSRRSPAARCRSQGWSPCAPRAGCR